MIGTDATGTFSNRDRTPPVSPAERPTVRLSVTGLTSGQLDGIDLSVAVGEILGIAGVDGNGQSDLEAVLCGRIAPTGGGVEIDGRPLDVGNPGSSASAGVAYIPSDRYRHGLVRAMDLSENLELGRTKRMRRGAGSATTQQPSDSSTERSIGRSGRSRRQPVGRQRTEARARPRARPRAQRGDRVLSDPWPRSVCCCVGRRPLDRSGRLGCRGVVDRRRARRVVRRIGPPHVLSRGRVAGGSSHRRSIAMPSDWR